MEKMKTLADQLREQMSKPADQNLPAEGTANPEQIKKAGKKMGKPTDTDILKVLLAYDNSTHKSMVHARFDKQTVDLMNKFKMATGIGVSKFVTYAVRHFLETHPELKTIIKQYLQNTEL
jgi:hypothetical protein